MIPDTIRPKDFETVINRKEILRNFRASGTSVEDFAKTCGRSRATLYRLIKKEKEGVSSLVDKRGRSKGRLLKINNEMSACC